MIWRRGTRERPRSALATALPRHPRWRCLPGLAPLRALAHRGIDARLQGNFAMRGTLTYVDHVFGEHAGSTSRKVDLLPDCAAGPVQAGSAGAPPRSRHQLDVLTLYRRGTRPIRRERALLAPLRCGGSVEVRRDRDGDDHPPDHGNATSGQSRFATELRATYVNPQRTNLTRCPGGIGHDAATYAGRSSPLPRPPTASFTATRTCDEHRDVYRRSHPAAAVRRSSPGRGTSATHSRPTTLHAAQPVAPLHPARDLHSQALRPRQVRADCDVQRAGHRMSADAAEAESEGVRRHRRTCGSDGQQHCGRTGNTRVPLPPEARVNRSG